MAWLFEQLNKPPRGTLVLVLMGAIALLPSCDNLYEDFTDKSSDAFIFDEARIALDDENWSKVISNMQPLVQRSPTNASYVQVLAAGYAGRAGLKILDLLTEIGTKIASKTLFQILAEEFPSASAAQISDLETAMALIEVIGDRGVERTPDLNFLYMFLHYSRIGAILNSVAYTSTTTLRSNFTACHRAIDFVGARTGITDANNLKVLVSLAQILDTIPYVAGSGAGFDALQSLVDEAPALDVTALPTACAGALPAECLAVRVFINSNDVNFGLGTFVAPEISDSMPCVSVTP